MLYFITKNQFKTKKKISLPISIWRRCRSKTIRCCILLLADNKWLKLWKIKIIFSSILLKSKTNIFSKLTYLQFLLNFWTSIGTGWILFATNHCFAFASFALFSLFTLFTLLLLLKCGNTLVMQFLQYAICKRRRL